VRICPPERLEYSSLFFLGQAFARVRDGELEQAIADLQPDIDAPALWRLSMSR
jgi:hypothetical protein